MTLEQGVGDSRLCQISCVSRPLTTLGEGRGLRVDDKEPEPKRGLLSLRSLSLSRVCVTSTI